MLREIDFWESIIPFNLKGPKISTQSPILKL